MDGRVGKQEGGGRHLLCPFGRVNNCALNSLSYSLAWDCGFLSQLSVVCVDACVCSCKSCIHYIAVSCVIVLLFVFLVSLAAWNTYGSYHACGCTIPVTYVKS